MLCFEYNIKNAAGEKSNTFNYVICAFDYAALGENSAQCGQGVYGCVLAYYRARIEDTAAAYISVVSEYCPYFTKPCFVVFICVNNYGLSVTFEI